MAELRVEVSNELAEVAKQLRREELNSLIRDALRERLSEKLMFRLADEFLKNSKITDELALKWGRELKQRAAKRHGV